MRTKIASISLILFLLSSMGIQAVDICTDFTCNNALMTSGAMAPMDTHRDMEGSHDSCDFDGNSSSCASSLADFPGLPFSLAEAASGPGSYSRMPMGDIYQTTPIQTGHHLNRRPRYGPPDGFGFSNPLYLSHMSFLC